MMSQNYPSFRDYIHLRRIRIIDICGDMGFNRSYISRFLSGELPYSKKMAKSIERITKGQIKADEIVGTYED